MPRSSAAARAIVGRRLREHRELAVAVDAEAEAQRDAAVREPVERRGLLRDDLGSAARDRCDHRSDAHPLGREGDRGGGHPRIGERRAGDVPEVVPDEDRVPTRGFSVRGERRDERGLGELFGQGE